VVVAPVGPNYQIVAAGGDGGSIRIETYWLIERSEGPGADRTNGSASAANGCKNAAI